MIAKKALVCRPENQAKELSDGLERIGLEVSVLPMIELRRLKDLSSLHQSFESLETIDWVVFTSSNAVNFFFEAADEYGLKLYFYPDLKFATVGEKTKLSLEQLGYRTNFVPMHYTAETLAANMDDVSKKHILIPRSRLASNDYIEAFEKRDAIVQAIDLYENRFLEYSLEITRKELAKKFDYLIFTSGSTFQSFHQNLLNASVTLQEEKIICIGPSTAKIVKGLGYKVVAIAEQYDTDGIISCIKKLEQNV